MADVSRLTAYLGHLVIENRHGLIVDALATTADGRAERDAAVLLLHERVKRRGRHRRIVGADRVVIIVSMEAGRVRFSCRRPSSRNVELVTVTGVWPIIRRVGQPTGRRYRSGRFLGIAKKFADFLVTSSFRTVQIFMVVLRLPNRYY